jgi:hypothetical protein
MCTRNERQAVVVIKGLGYVLSKCVPSASRRDSPSTSVIWVRPEQVTHRALMGHLLYPIQRANVVKGINARGKATVQAEDLVLDKGGEGEEVEEVGEVLPYVCVAVLAKAFIVETIDLGNLAGFVVAAEDGYALRVADLQGDKKGDGLYREVATVDVIACDKLAAQFLCSKRKCGEMAYP